MFKEKLNKLSVTLLKDGENSIQLKNKDCLDLYNLKFFYSHKIQVSYFINGVDMCIEALEGEFDFSFYPDKPNQEIVIKLVPKKPTRLELEATAELSRMGTVYEEKYL